MPPPSSQKGMGKKGGAGAMARQRSRNTTPSSVPASGPSAPGPGTAAAASGPSGGTATASLPAIESTETEYLDLKFDMFRNITYEDLVDAGASNAVVPDSRSLDGILSRLQQLHDMIERRGQCCDRGMRLLAAGRRARMDEMAAAERSREEERLRKEADEEEKERRANKKKRKASENLGPQDSNIERTSPLRELSGKPRKQSQDNDSASSSLSPVEPATPGAMDVDEKTQAEANDSSSSSSDEGDGRPRKPAAPAFQTFGEDPSTFPDPTVYEIPEAKPGMSEEELKDIYSVAVYPTKDLSELIAGNPPDKDFSSAKPSNQISFSTFSTYVEPYFRPFAEEDLAFLRERGDRVTPFVMPKRGKKHYTDVWAEEDGAMAIDSSPQGRDRLEPNQPRGTIDNMDDDVAETDKLSVGPLLSRLLCAMRPEPRAQAGEDKPTTNGDMSMNGDFSLNGDHGSSNPNGETDNSSSLPPATYMAESSSESWKKASHPKLDYSQVDERIKQELRHIGFLPLPESGGGPSSSSATQNGADGGPGAGGGGGNNNNGGGGAAGPSFGAAADYDGHYDDEVAARLRLLQDRLREQMLINGARKARLTDLVKERMAHQEYHTILEDLDAQVQGAYLKRTRTMGKSKKAKRPGGAGAGGTGAGAAGAGGGAAGTARPGIGDLTKTLMERRRRWIDNIGTVFDDEGLGRVPRAADGDTSIFRPAEMAELMKREKEAWDEEVEED